MHPEAGRTIDVHIRMFLACVGHLSSYSQDGTLVDRGRALDGKISLCGKVSASYRTVLAVCGLVIGAFARGRHCSQGAEREWKIV